MGRIEAKRIIDNVTGKTRKAAHADRERKIQGKVAELQASANKQQIQLEESFNIATDERARSLQEALPATITDAFRQAKEGTATLQRLKAQQPVIERAFTDAQAKAQRKQAQADEQKTTATALNERVTDQDLKTKTATAKTNADELRKAAIARLVETRTTRHDTAQAEHDAAIQAVQDEFALAKQKAQETHEAVTDGQTPEDAHTYTPAEILEAYRLVMNDTEAMNIGGLKRADQLQVLRGVLARDYVNLEQNRSMHDNYNYYPVDTDDFRSVDPSSNYYTAIAALVELGRIVKKVRNEENHITASEVFRAYELVFKDSYALSLTGLNQADQLQVLRGVLARDYVNLEQNRSMHDNYNYYPVDTDDFTFVTQLGTAFAPLKALLAIPEVLTEQQTRQAQIEQTYRETTARINGELTQAKQAHDAFNRELLDVLKQTTISQDTLYKLGDYGLQYLDDQQYANYVRKAFTGLGDDDAIRKLLRSMEYPKEPKRADDPYYASFRALQAIHQKIEDSKAEQIKAKNQLTKDHEGVEARLQEQIAGALPPIDREDALSLLRFAKLHPNLAQELLSYVSGTDIPHDRNIKNMLTSMRIALKHGNYSQVLASKNPGLYQFLRALDNARNATLAERGGIGPRVGKLQEARRGKEKSFAEKERKRKLLTETSDKFLKYARGQAKSTMYYFWQEIGVTIKPVVLTGIAAGLVESLATIFLGSETASAVATGVLVNIASVPVVGPAVVSAGGLVAGMPPILFAIVGSTLLAAGGAGLITWARHRIKKG